MTEGATYDTGMLIALERHKARALKIHERLLEAEIRVTVPTVVLAEWWRGRTDDREDILGSVEIEPGSSARVAAKSAGEALAHARAPREDETCRSKLLVDAVVMASAALRGDLVYTSDVDDLSQLSASFPGVRLLSV